MEPLASASGPSFGGRGLGAMASVQALGRPFARRLCPAAPVLTAFVEADGTSRLHVSTMRILQAMNIEHPVAMMARSAALSHARSTGASTTSFVVLLGMIAAELSRCVILHSAQSAVYAARHLTQRVLVHGAVLEGVRCAAEHCAVVLQSVALPLPGAAQTPALSSPQATSFSRFSRHASVPAPVPAPVQCLVDNVEVTARLLCHGESRRAAMGIAAQVARRFISQDCLSPTRREHGGSSWGDWQVSTRHVIDSRYDGTSKDGGNVQLLDGVLVSLSQLSSLCRDTLRLTRVRNDSRSVPVLLCSSLSDGAGSAQTVDAMRVHSSSSLLRAAVVNALCGAVPQAITGAATGKGKGAAVAGTSSVRGVVFCRTSVMPTAALRDALRAAGIVVVSGVSERVLQCLALICRCPVVPTTATLLTHPELKQAWGTAHLSERRDGQVLFEESRAGAGSKLGGTGSCMVVRMVPFTHTPSVSMSPMTVLFVSHTEAGCRMLEHAYSSSWSALKCVFQNTPCPRHGSTVSSLRPLLPGAGVSELLCVCAVEAAAAEVSRESCKPTSFDLLLAEGYRILARALRQYVVATAQACGASLDTATARSAHYERSFARVFATAPDHTLFQWQQVPHSIVHDKHIAWCVHVPFLALAGLDPPIVPPWRVRATGIHLTSQHDTTASRTGALLHCCDALGIKLQLLRTTCRTASLALSADAHVLPSSAVRGGMRVESLRASQYTEV